MDVERKFLDVADYAILSIALLVSAGIGIYFRFAGGRQKTTEEYLLAGKNMSILPVAFSLMASFLSAITVIGIPAEMYQYGIYMAYMNIGWAVGMVISSYLFLPVFFNMQVTTAYEYLDRRYGRTARTLCSFAFVIQMILYMSVVLYAPALALSAITNLSTWISVVSVGVVCTFYCTLGGMKAVLWTDVFQAILMYLCIITIIIKGCMDNGGLANIFLISNDGGRVVMPSFSPDPTMRYTIWNVTLQGLFLAMLSVAGNQVQIQRLLTVKNIVRSRKALFISIPMGISFNLMNCLAGLIIYVNFVNCDPMTSPNKPIKSADQLLPYYIMVTFKDYPGLPGLCICGIFSASLSTVSSAVNSLTAVTMQDLIWPFFSKNGVSPNVTAFCAKAITFSYGFLCVMLTFAVAAFGNLIQASVTVYGMLGGPVLGAFFLGMMTTRSNERGVVIGFLASVILSSWLSFGASANAPPHKMLPVTTEGCFHFDALNNYSFPAFKSLTTDHPVITLPVEPTISFLNSTLSSEMEHSSLENPLYLYRLSFMLFAPIGFAVSALIGYLASIVINLFADDKKTISPEFLSPVVRWFMERAENSKKCTYNSDPVELQPINYKLSYQIPEYQVYNQNELL